MDMKQTNMKIYEIFYPELDSYVKFKVLPPSALDDFMEACAHMHKQEFMKFVVDNLIYNLKSEIIINLKKMDSVAAVNTLQSLYYGCLMLNPRLDIDDWLRISSRSIETPVEMSASTEILPFLEEDEPATEPQKIKKVSKSKYLSLKDTLRQLIVGQDEAIDVVADALKRSIVGLEDKNSPLGVFLFAGSSGVGKSELAKQICAHLYGKNSKIVRIDCGLYQQKHNAQSLTGSSAGYIGYDEGGLLTNKVIENPNTVILLDEVEKAHPDFWNAFLTVFDEGYLTDNKGNVADFRNTIVVMTTNLGNDKLLSVLEAKGVGFGNNTKVTLAKDRVEAIVVEKVKEYFKPELVNRIDKIVVFNHLTHDDLGKIANLELEKVAQKLSSRSIRFQWDDSIIEHMVNNAESHFKGARGMASIRRETVESVIADTLLENTCPRGTILDLVSDGSNFKINITKPIKKKSQKEG